MCIRDSPSAATTGGRPESLSRIPVPRVEAYVGPLRDRTVRSAHGRARARTAGYVTFPTEPVPVPTAVAHIAAGRPVRAVWLNELGGVTFRVDGGEYVKVYPEEYANLLVTEGARMRWAGRYLAVPRVLSSGPGWLHTAAPVSYTHLTLPTTPYV